MKLVKKSLFFFMLFSVHIWAECSVPQGVDAFIVNRGLKNLKKSDKDVRRNMKALKGLCLYEVAIKDKNLNWKMTLVFNQKHKNAPFWFLPHDNEDTAFNTAVYAVQKYGGGFLAVEANEKRYFKGQDPNRNFSDTLKSSKSCVQQKYFSPRYTQGVLTIIQAFKPQGYPYLTLHNNSDGGGVSMLHKSKRVMDYPAYKGISKKSRGLKDEDSLVYMAGNSKHPSTSRLKPFLKNGLNVKYEMVSAKHNDCSFSNYIVLSSEGDYYNIESEHGDDKVQRAMVDRILRFF